MDPRPYNYEYRRARPNNLTYQSYHAGQSLYHMGNQQFYNPNSLLRDQHAQRFNLYSPNYSNPYQRMQRHKQEPKYSEIGVNTDKINRSPSSNYTSRSKSTASHQEQPSILSNYGSNSLSKKDVSPASNNSDVNIVFNHTNDSSMIFKKQQRPFNIINLYSRYPEPLKVYPKLTRQHLL